MATYTIDNQLYCARYFTVNDINKDFGPNAIKLYRYLDETQNMLIEKFFVSDGSHSDVIRQIEQKNALFRHIYRTY